MSPGRGQGWDVDPTSGKFKAAELVVTFIGATAPLFGWNAFQFTIYGAAFNISFAPLLIILWMIMSSRENVMGELKTKPLMNVGLVFAIAVVLSATWRFWSGVLGG